MFACLDCIDEGLIPTPEAHYTPVLCVRHRDQGTADGARWVTIGEGSSIAELLDASGEGSASELERRQKTDLLLTGHPLGRRDLRRVRDAVQWARSRACPPPFPRWPGGNV